MSFANRFRWSISIFLIDFAALSKSQNHLSTPPLYKKHSEAPSLWDFLNMRQFCKASFCYTKKFPKFPATCHLFLIGANSMLRKWALKCFLILHATQQQVKRFKKFLKLLSFSQIFFAVGGNTHLKKQRESGSGAFLILMPKSGAFLIKLLFVLFSF